MALCAGYVLTGSASLASNDVSPEASAIPLTLVDQETEALLRTVEQQISAQHIVSPLNDNAMETWRRVLQRKVTIQNSPAFLRALADFETRARNSAANDKAAGDILGAVTLNVFADEATRLAGNIPPFDQRGIAGAAPDVTIPEAPSESSGAASPPSGAATRESAAEPAVAPTPAGVTREGATEPATVPAPAVATREGAADRAGVTAPTRGGVTREDSIDQAASQSQSPRPGTTPPNSPGAEVPLAETNRDNSDTSSVAGGADTSAPRPTSTVGNMVVTPPVPTMPPDARAPSEPEPAMAAFYATRGDQMLALKDISAARRFYEYAANAGSARAATALARTFDAAFIIQLGVVGLKPDAELAAAWYRKAAILGDPRSDTRLLTQGAATAK